MDLETLCHELLRNVVREYHIPGLTKREIIRYFDEIKSRKKKGFSKGHVDTFLREILRKIESKEKGHEGLRVQAHRYGQTVVYYPREVAEVFDK